MRLTLSGTTLLLENDQLLRSYMAQQLAYFGGHAIEGSHSYEFEAATAELIGSLLAYFEAENTELTLAAEVQSILDAQVQARRVHESAMQTASEFKDGKYDSKAYAQHKEFLRSHIKRTLLDHQVKASFHLGLIGNGANFSVPGSGKTTVLLAYYEKLRLQGDVDAVFVVGPPACFGPWRNEFEAVLGRKPNEVLLAGGDQAERKRSYTFRNAETELYLTTFQTLQNDFADAQTLLDGMKGRILLVVDEAHYMKQLEGRWASAVLAIAPHANFRCVLTGTPIPHGYKDLFNLFSFLWQEHSPITVEDHARLDNYEKNKDFHSALELLNPKLGPLFYRVRKKDLHLSRQIMNEVIVPMKPIERKIYDVVLGNIRDLSTEDYLKQGDALAALRKARVMRLRQAVSYPRLLATAIQDYSEDVLGGDENALRLITKYDEVERTGKLEKLLMLVKEYRSSGLKIVIWTNFLGTVDLIMEALKEEGIEARKIVGQTPIEREGLDIEGTREKIREEFVDPNSGVDCLVANPAACAESISLHKTCHHAIYYDLSFNCAQFLQSLDRIHRVGGSEKQEVQYDFLMYADSVDTKIYDNLNEKAEKMKALIDQDFSIYSLDMLEAGEEFDLEDMLK